MVEVPPYIVLLGQQAHYHRAFEELLRIAYGENVELAWMSWHSLLEKDRRSPVAIVVFCEDSQEEEIQADALSLLQETFPECSIIRIVEDARPEFSVQFLNPQVLDQQAGGRLRRHSLAGTLRVALQIANRRKQYHV